LTLVNGCKADVDASVSDGDRVDFFPHYIPSHKVYGMCVLYLAHPPCTSPPARPRYVRF